MNSADVCSTCGAPLPGGALGMRCARCLLETGLLDHLAQAQREADEKVTGGERFGDYELLEEIARGGMGIVFKARQLSLNRIVAIKMLLSGQYATPEALQRFRVEAEAAAHLHHPNIVAIHDFGEHEGQPYFSMDYVPGRSLADLTKSGPLPSRSAVRYVQQMAQAIHYAHQQGILHRDLKPSNILIDPDDDQPRITDFGLAKRQASDSAITLTGQTLGTPNYIPPEQVAGQHSRMGPWSDVYSLGAVLYHLLTGRAPFMAETITTTLRLVQEAEPVALRLLNPVIPRDLETICLKCLEKEPSRRYATAQELADELGRFLKGEPIHARPIGSVSKGWRWCRRNPRLAVMGAVFAVAVMVIFGLAAWLAVARRQERLEIYASSIALADRYIKDGSIDRALDLLYKCPAEFRHWEWGHSLYLCHQDIVSIPAHTNRSEGWYRYTSLIKSLAFDSTGTRLTTVGSDGKIKVWDSGNGTNLFEFGNTNQKVTSWAFHPTGIELALGMANGSIRIFNATNWQETSLRSGTLASADITGERQFAATPGSGAPKQPPLISITSIAYDPPGRKLAAATSDGRVTVWERQSGRELFAATNEPVPIGKIWFTPDGRQLVTRRLLAVRKFDAETGRVLFTFPFKDEPAEYQAVFVDATGQNLATVDLQNRVRLWSGNNPTHVLGILTLAQPFFRVIFSPDGRLVCTAGDQGTARLYEVQSGQALFAIPERVREIAFNADGTRLAVAGGERLSKVWDIAEGKELLVLRGQFAVAAALAFSPDGRLVAAASEDGFVQIWSSSPGRERYPVGNCTWAAAYSPNGKRLTATGWWDNLKVWDADSGRLELILKSRTHFPFWAEFSPDPGGSNIVSVGTEKVARIWDAHSGNVRRILRGHNSALIAVAYSPNGRWIATADAERIVKIWEAETGVERHVLSGHRGQVWNLNFDRTSRQLLTADLAGPPRVWDVESGKLRLVLEGGSAGTMTARFSPNGQQIAAPTRDRFLRIWDARSGRLVKWWQMRANSAQEISYSPDGRRLAVPVTDNYVLGHDPGTIEIWDVEHGRQLLDLRNHAEPVNAARFSPDGRRLLTSAMDFAARQEESFPWREADYAALPGATLPERVRSFARTYWQKRLAAEGAGTALTPPVIPSVDTDRDLIPPRNPQAGPDLINLTAFYTSLLDSPIIPWGSEPERFEDLTALGSGLMTLGGVRFDVRGLVLLGRREPKGGFDQRMWARYPKSVNSIQIRSHLHRLQILQGAYCRPLVQDGTPIGGLVWHYSDGSQRETEIIYGRDVRDWWFGGAARDKQDQSQRGHMVWTGDSPEAKIARARLRLYLTTYDNPQPDLEVTSLDFVSKMTTAAPFLIALTIDP